MRCLQGQKITCSFTENLIILSDWIFRFRFYWIYGYKKIHIWLFIPFSRRNNLIKECKVIYYCCIHYESWICGMLWGYNSNKLVANFISGLQSTISPSHWKLIVIILQFFFFKNDMYSKGAKHMKLKYLSLKKKLKNKNYQLNILA